MWNLLLCSGSKLFLHLQVVERSSLRCFQPEEGSVELLNNVGGSILCPGHNCSDNRDVTWYKVRPAHRQTLYKHTAEWGQREGHECVSFSRRETYRCQSWDGTSAWRTVSYVSVKSKANMTTDCISVTDESRKKESRGRSGGQWKSLS